MSKNKLEFKIVKDSNGKKIDLDNLSLGSAKALATFLNSIIKIIEALPDNDGIRFKVQAGSALVTAEGPEQKMLKLENDFQEVIEHSSRDKDLIEGWKEVQLMLLRNGLTYEVNLYDKHNVKKPLIDQIKVKRIFRVKPKTRKRNPINLNFIKGKLMLNGGKKPNFHIDDNGVEKIIQCPNEITAQKVNTFLYKEVLISAWKKDVVDNKSKYYYCDIYINESDFLEFEEFVTKNNTLSESQEFVAMHDKFKSALEKSDFAKVRKLMRLYNHSLADIGNMKTVLVITKGLKAHPEIKDLRASIKSILEEKIKKNLY